MKTIKLFSIFSMFVLLFTTSASAQEAVYTGTFSSEAISGYDSVSYFTEGAPVKGSSEFKTKWHGATWKFSSQENLDTFKADPEKYAPQYGGHCAWALADGNFYEGDPKVWEIYGGKLYLNYNETVKEKWVQDKDGFITAADIEYPKAVDLK